MKNQKGFSLIELLIVVVIIGIIAAIAIPNLIAARRAANEGAAQSTTRTLHSGQVTFQATSGAGNFAASLTEMESAKLIDTTLATGVKSGYSFGTGKLDFNTTTRRPASFAVGAYPTAYAAGVTQTGTRGFCMAVDGRLVQYKPSTIGSVASNNINVIVGTNDVTCANTGATMVE